MNHSYEVLQAQLDCGCRDLSTAKITAILLENFIVETLGNHSDIQAHKLAKEFLTDLFLGTEDLGNCTGSDQVNAYGLRCPIYSEKDSDVTIYLDIVFRGDGMVLMELKADADENLHLALYPLMTTYFMLPAYSFALEAVELSNKIRAMKKAQRAYYATKGKERKEKKERKGLTKALDQPKGNDTLRLGR